MGAETSDTSWDEIASADDSGVCEIKAQDHPAHVTCAVCRKVEEWHAARSSGWKVNEHGQGVCQKHAHVVRVTRSHGPNRAARRQRLRAGKGSVIAKALRGIGRWRRAKNLSRADQPGILGATQE